MTQVIPCAYEAVAHFKAPAAKERSSVAPSRDTLWWGAHADSGELVGCAGLIVKSGQWARIKGVYVDPAHRGQGIGAALTEAQLSACEELLVPRVEAYALNPDYYRGLGFTVGKERTPGIWHVWRNL